MEKFSFILNEYFFLFIYFALEIIFFIEYTLLVDKKMILLLSFFAFSKILKVPTKFVKKTLSDSNFDASTAASAQQSIIKSYFINELIFDLFEIFKLKFFIFCFLSLFKFIFDEFLLKLSKLWTVNLSILFLRKIAIFDPINPQPPVIKIFMSLSIIIPIRNEEENIENITKKISQLRINLELCFIDDFSKDNSFKKVLEVQKEFPFVKIIRNKKIGLGSAINTGLDSVKNEFTCIMMCDDSDSLSDLKKYYKIISLKNCDAVFGSRFYKESVVKNYPIKKLVLNRIFNFLVSILFLNKFNDYTNAFKIYKSSSLKKLKPIVSESFNVFLEIPLKVISRKMKYETTSISWMGREKGVSKFKIKELQSKYLFTLLYCLLEKILIK